MNETLKSFPAPDAKRSFAGLTSVRSVLLAALLWAARSAVLLAARLEKSEAAVGGKRVVRASVPAAWPGGGGGVRLVEAVVGLAVAAYFVSGLVGVFVS